MTVQYDGRLVLHTKPPAVDACCRVLDTSVVLGAVSVGRSGQVPVLRIRDGPKGNVMSFCPFCGAAVEVFP